MQLRNRRGTPVDPVPFLVVVSLAFAVSYSYGPIYLMAFGLSLPWALGGSTITFLGVSVFAYHRYVWTFEPDLLDEVPIASRFKRLYYGVLIGVVVIALLSLPLFVL